MPESPGPERMTTTVGSGVKLEEPELELSRRHRCCRYRCYTLAYKPCSESISARPRQKHDQHGAISRRSHHDLMILPLRRDGHDHRERGRAHHDHDQRLIILLQEIEDDDRDKQCHCGHGGDDGTDEAVDVLVVVEVECAFPVISTSFGVIRLRFARAGLGEDSP